MFLSTSQYLIISWNYPHSLFAQKMCIWNSCILPDHICILICFVMYTFIVHIQMLCSAPLSWLAVTCRGSCKNQLLGDLQTLSKPLGLQHCVQSLVCLLLPLITIHENITWKCGLPGCVLRLQGGCASILNLFRVRFNSEFNWDSNGTCAQPRPHPLSMWLPWIASSRTPYRTWQQVLKLSN